MDKEREFIYRYPNPGYRVTLWDEEGEKPIVNKQGKTTALFRDTGNGIDRCGIFRTKEVKVKEALERTKAFKVGNITKVLSPDDIALESKKLKEAEEKKVSQKMMKNGLFDLDKIKGMKYQDLKDYAKSIGAYDSERRKKDEILEDVEKQLFPEPEEE